MGLSQTKYQRGGEGFGEDDDDDYNPRQYETREEKYYRHQIRKLKQRVQLQMDTLRGMSEDDNNYFYVMAQLVSNIERLEDLGVPAHTLDVDAEWFEEAKEYVEPKSRKVAFGTPSVAFYEPATLGRHTQLPRHESLEELSRHQDEMSDAFRQAEENPRWYGGKRRSYF